MPSVVIVASRDLTPELGHTVLWRNAIERTFASSPDVGFEEARTLVPNLLVLDAASVESPASFIRRVRRDPVTRATSVVVLSPSPSHEDEEALRVAGANVVLSGRADPLVWDARLEELLTVPARREARIPVRLQAWSRFPPTEGLVVGTALNISLHGALLETTDPLDVGTKLDISFRLPADDVQLQAVGEVVRDAGVAGGAARSAIRFLILRGDARERIRTVIESSLSYRVDEPAGAAAVPVPTDVVELAEWEAELRASEARKAAILDSAFDCIITMDAEGRIVEFNRSAERTFGYARADVVGRTVEETIVPPALRERHRRGLARTLATGLGPMIGTRVEMTGMRADGSEFPMELAVTPIQLDRRRFFTGYLRDITDRKRAEALQSALYRIAEKASLATDMHDLYAGIHAIVAELMHAENLYIALYDEAAQVLTFPYFVDEKDSKPQAKKLGKGLTDYVLRTGRALLASPETFSELQQRGEVVSVGTPSVDWLGVPLKAGDKTIGILAVQSYQETTRYGEREKEVLAFVSQHIGDAIERRRAAQRLEYQAHHDILTGLPNRLLLTDRLSVALTRARRHGRQVAVMFLDLDHLKLINDTLGHGVGDRLLQALAERLRARLRAEDTLARVGDDEFILLFGDVAGGHDAARMAGKILKLAADPFVVDDRELYVTASIGVALYPNDGGDAESLLQSADGALYRAKELGRNNYQLCTPGMNIRAMERMALEKDLRRALERSEFVLYYQPLVDLATGLVVGMESLLRWQHPERGLMAPDAFIPLAEDSRLIIPIGDWVLRTACQQLRAWQDAGFLGLRVAVNLSAHQFEQQDLPRTIEAALRETGVAPECLEIEITESIAMQNAEWTTGVLRVLKGMGIRISIDDFGTGQSSLSYLKHFPVSTLKIDRSFVQDVAIDPDDESIVKAVIALAHSLKLKVIAEGVETSEQLAFLRRARCEEGQGHLFGNPQPAAMLTGALEGRRFRL